MIPVVFDTHFKNSSDIGVEVDSTLYVEFYENTELTPKYTRVIGNDAASSIVKSSDSEGVFYTTTLDGSLFNRGTITAKWYASLSNTRTSPYPFVETLANPYQDETLTPSRIKNYIRGNLGVPAVAVELASSQYALIVEETLALYGQHVPMERVRTVQMLPSVTAYQLTGLPYDGPFDVKFIRKQGFPVISDPLFGRQFPREGFLDMPSYIISLSYWEQLLRVGSSEPDWYWIGESKTLFLNIGPNDVNLTTGGGYYVMARYYVSTPLDKVREDHHRWFLRYCLALAKRMLVQIRGKYGGVVPAPGGKMVLNSDPLREEAEKEESELRDELRSMSPPTPPILG